MAEPALSPPPLAPPPLAPPPLAPPPLRARGRRKAPAGGSTNRRVGCQPANPRPLWRASYDGVRRPVPLVALRRFLSHATGEVLGYAHAVDLHRPALS